MNGPATLTARYGAAALRQLDEARTRPVLMVLAFALLLALPALINGKPFLFYDSAHYFDIGQSIVLKLKDALAPAAEAAAVGAAAAADAVSVAPADPGGGLVAIAGGRSPVYSLIVYIYGNTYSLFAVVAIQSLIAGWLLFRTLDLFLGTARNAEKLALVAALSALTPLGFHAGFIMPDVFAGLFVLAALNLIFDRTLNRADTLVMAALLILSACMHSTILPLGMVFILSVLAVKCLPALRGDVNFSAAGWIAASLALALAVSGAYKIGVEKATGEAVQNPPYLMARLIADGTGTKYLQEHCSTQSFAACAFRDTDYVDHNDFLWGGSGAAVNFSTMDMATKHRLQAEEIDFVRAVIAAYPGQQAAASIGNALHQLVMTGITETQFGAEHMVHQATFGSSAILEHEPGVAACRAGTVPCRERSPVREAWGTTILWVTLAAMAVLLVWTGRDLLALWRGEALSPARRRLALAGAICLTLLAANAVVCGVLSAPHDRYQARLAWIAALILGAALLNAMTERRDGAA